MRKGHFNPFLIKPLLDPFSEFPANLPLFLGRRLDNGPKDQCGFSELLHPQHLQGFDDRAFERFLGLKVFPDLFENVNNLVDVFAVRNASRSRSTGTSGRG